MYTQIIAVELLLHVGGPVLFISGIIPLAEAIRFITVNTLDIREFGNDTSSFQLKKTRHGSYWVVVDSFYFPLKGDNVEESSEDDTPSNLLCDRNCSTWGIYSIILISVLLGVSILVYNFTVSNAYYAGCSQLSSELAKLSVCFTTEAHTYINCSSNTSYMGIVGCYHLFPLLCSSSLASGKIETVIEAFLIIMITDRMIYFLFKLMKQMLLIRWTKLWAAGISIIGAFLVVGVVIYYFFSLNGHTTVTFFSKSEIYSLFIFSSDVMIVGLLLLFGHVQMSVTKQNLKMAEANIATANGISA